MRAGAVAFRYPRVVMSGDAGGDLRDMKGNSFTWQQFGRVEAAAYGRPCGGHHCTQEGTGIGRCAGTDAHLAFAFYEARACGPEPVPEPAIAQWKSGGRQAWLGEFCVTWLPYFEEGATA